MFAGSVRKKIEEGKGAFILKKQYNSLGDPEDGHLSVKRGEEIAEANGYKLIEPSKPRLKMLPEFHVFVRIFIVS